LNTEEPTPEREIEKLLRQCAQERAAEAETPLELHPATRRFLQAEVARKYGSAGREARSSRIFSRLWPRLAWLSSLAALGVLAILYFGRTSSPQRTLQLAKKESLPPSPQLKEPVPAAPETSTSAERPLVLALDYRQQSNSFEKSKVESSLPTFEVARDTSPLSANNGVIPTEKTARARRYREVSPESALSESAVSNGAPEATSLFVQAQSNTSTDLNLADQYEAEAITLAAPTQKRSQSEGQAFSQRTSAASATPANPSALAKPVLQSFQVEQIGNELRVRDADGSIYAGRLQAGELDRPARAAYTQQPAMRRAQSASGNNTNLLRMGIVQGQAQRQFSFQVLGTNQTLNQRVLFSGTIFFSTNTTAASIDRRISGRVTVGNGPEMPVNAVRTERQK